jgi:hypothetical protein
MPRLDRAPRGTNWPSSSFANTISLPIKSARGRHRMAETPLRRLGDPGKPGE